MFHNKKIRNSIAILLTLFLTIVMLYFVVYEEEHYNHICNDQNCPICHVLSAASTFTKNICSGNSSASAGIFFVTYAILFVYILFCAIVKRNLIIDKVRLDD